MSQPLDLSRQFAMEPRIDYRKDIYRGAMQAMYGLEMQARRSRLEQDLLHLVKVRCSQINGCSFCIDMHTKEARASGETEQRLYALSAWRETLFYTDRECAALEWAETLTLIAQRGVPDDVYRRTSRHFSEEELVALTLAIIAINGWNRLAISAGTVPGSYAVDHAAAP